MPSPTAVASARIRNRTPGECIIRHFFLSCLPRLRPGRPPRAPGRAFCSYHPVEAHHAKKSGSSQMGNPPDDLSGSTRCIYGGARQCSPGWAGWRVPSGALSKPFTIRVAGRGIIISRPATIHPMSQYTAPVRPGGAPRSSDPVVGPPYPRPRGRTRPPGVCARGRRRDGSRPHSGRSP